MIRTISSCRGVPIRLTDERWAHIVEEHCELAGLREDVLEAVGQPEKVFSGRAGELLALRRLDDRRFVVVVYRESSPDDGFVITAFVTTRVASLMRREQVWPPRM
jgi:hypothetical protein